ncbi:MAG: asparagine synthase (glutamine-hydrolyzing) [Flavisolibacter sp.]|nr:asparagine synthase (glutamine-hydrolyzing) [Flavisolibacter sp.]
MCGIAGIFRMEDPAGLPSSVKRMTEVLSHRGPDGEGFFIREEKGIALGHRRLSIIDLSEEANQPMISNDGRYVMVFNGEIYNYIELREKLLAEGVAFHTTSDTEVLLAAYIQRKEKCLQDLDGMFAFAIWDNEEGNLFCARDRFGEKPFYYVYEPGKYFAFASEIKAIRTLPGFDDINQQQLYNFLAFGYVFTPNVPQKTFFTKIHKLPPATYCNVSGSVSLQEKPYWQLANQEDESVRFEFAQHKVNELLTTSIKRRLRSDVPIGSSLSGGLDSSIIVCLIDSFNTDKSIRQNTFSAKFPGFNKDESYFIDKVIEQTKVNPYFTYPTEAGFLEAFEKLCYYQDEPFGSASIFAQWEVMRLAKENHVTVLLDGQGADEVLAGYHQYYTPYFQELFLKNRSAYKVQWQQYVHLQPSRIPRDFKFYGGIFLKNQKQYFGWLKDKLDNKFKDYFNAEFYRQNKRSSFARNILTRPSLNHELLKSVTDGSLETLLRLADRNAMAHSREVRLPFLSHELVEFLFTLPAEYKIADGWTKHVARKAFESILPQEIVWRKDKIGYEPPQKSWMAHKKVQDLIEESKRLLVKEKILNEKVLRESILPSGASERGNNSWNYLMAGKLFGLK